MIAKKCKMCGADMLVNNDRTQYCLDCAVKVNTMRKREYRKRRRELNGEKLMTETVVCAECGKTVKRTGTRQKYCDECSEQVRVRQAKERWARQKAQRAENPRLEPCDRCGAIIEKKAPNHRYCLECAAEIDRQRKENNRLSNKTSRYDKAKKRIKKKMQAQEKGASEISRLAREAWEHGGLSYGQYTAMLRSVEG